MSKNRPLIVAGLVFALVALLHLARVYYSVPVMFGTMTIPESWSVIGFFVATFLSIWMFIAAKK